MPFSFMEPQFWVYIEWASLFTDIIEKSNVSLVRLPSSDEKYGSRLGNSWAWEMQALWNEVDNQL